MILGYRIIHQKICWLLFLSCILPVRANAWQEGYNFRKKITIPKTKVIATNDLTDFVFLLELQDTTLRFISGQCQSNRVSGYSRPDICFSTANGTELRLSAQVEQYNPNTGRLLCWVSLPMLSALGTQSPATSLYIYYGSSMVADPYSISAVTTWHGAAAIWHMDPEGDSGSVRNGADQDPSAKAIGFHLTTPNYVEGKIGKAVHLQGSPSRMTGLKDTSTRFAISGWIKIDQRGKEQVIVSNRSEDGGYELCVGSGGDIQIRIYNYGFRYELISTTVLTEATWYFVGVSLQDKVLALSVNGIEEGSTRHVDLKIAGGGTISIGSSVNSDRYFTGMLDELRIRHDAKNMGHLSVEYANQNNTLAFYSLGNEETSAMAYSKGPIFTGTVDDNWLNPANWSILEVPSAAGTINIAKNKIARLSGVARSTQQLLLEENAVLHVQSDLTAHCLVTLKAGARIIIDGDRVLQLDGNIQNAGIIATEDGRLLFAGDRAQQISGAGYVRVANFSVQKNTANLVIQLLQSIYVIHSLTLDWGIVETHDNLTLGLSNDGITAQYFQTAGQVQAALIGSVAIEKYIKGGFIYPGTGRGWRLLSSPVYQICSASLPQFDLHELQNAMFITGKEGANNGFDNSPLDGNTIYTHVENLYGALTDRYQPIQNMDQKIPLGDGVFVFSRGSRLIPDAFTREIVSPPFINPDGYVVTYRGNVWTTDLIKTLYNSHKGELGDGFNLLGNPYPFSIKWGALITSGLSPFIWLYDPINQSYDVTDDPNATINPGTGFFVKVNPEVNSGSLVFKGYQSTAIASRLSVQPAMQALSVTIIKDDFMQRYKIVLTPDGTDGGKRASAEKIGTGIVSIAGISPERKKLSIDRRGSLAQPIDILLSVQGQLSGKYFLRFDGLETFQPATRITLEDRFLKQRIPFSGTVQSYPFDIDKSKSETEGDNRFLLHIDGSAAAHQDDKNITVYPNPFTDVFFVKTKAALPENINIRIRDMLGNLVLTRKWKNTEKNGVVTISGMSLNKGIYFLELIDSATDIIFKFAKVIKQ